MEGSSEQNAEVMISFDGNGNAKRANVRMRAFLENQTRGGLLGASFHLRRGDITWWMKSEDMEYLTGFQDLLIYFPVSPRLPLHLLEGLSQAGLHLFP